MRMLSERNGRMEEKEEQRRRTTNLRHVDGMFDCLSLFGRN